MRIQYNIQQVNSLEDFFCKTGPSSPEVREVFFVRAQGGFPESSETLLKLEQTLLEQMQKEGASGYLRIKNLSPLTGKEELTFYSNSYEAWKSGQPLTLQNIRMSPVLQETFREAYQKTLRIYQTHEKNATDSMVRNLGVTLLYWLDTKMWKPLERWAGNRILKVAGENVMKTKEYLFYYLLTGLGFDVLLLEPKEDVKVSESLKQLSSSIYLGPYSTSGLPEFRPYRPAPKTVPTVRVHPPEKFRTLERAEKSYEELACLASSVVMISIHDPQGKIIGTGSGIMIGSKGYILTNDHVACGGSFFSVRLEEEEKAFQTDEIIKYNPSLDLAIIRIPRLLHPLPLYSGEKPLVRGQKVVAIGSPLGLFNSISDGIISGFRKVNDVDMIQFTAPISHGSSGGAILNMYGEVIGISTAGFAEGQNINLAVRYENIRTFAQGFLEK